MMSVTVREYTDDDMDSMIAIWNEVIEEGIAFPQEEFLNRQTAPGFFAGQSYCGVAAEFRADPGSLYSASEQRGKMRTYRQCQLCGIFLKPWTSCRREAGSGLSETGPQNRISYSAV